MFGERGIKTNEILFGGGFVMARVLSRRNIFIRGSFITLGGLAEISNQRRSVIVIVESEGHLREQSSGFFFSLFQQQESAVLLVFARALVGSSLRGALV